ncbi:MAG: rhodanese-like domain-containing protein, partial [Deltaproteobacteria bacterium]
MPQHRLVLAGILAVVLAVMAGGNVLAGRADYPEKAKEIIAITFAKEMMEGGYKAVTAEQLKKWIDEKKNLLIVDTMPLEASFKKQHIPGAVQIEFPIPEMKKIDKKK